MKFFDSIAIKQFLKLQNVWFERYVEIKDKKNAFFFLKNRHKKKIEKKLNLKLAISRILLSILRLE